MSDSDSLEAAIQSLGRNILAHATRAELSVLDGAWWEEKVLEWAMAHPELKVQLFRFMDVLPVLAPSAITAHLVEYLGDARDDLPPPLRWGVDNQHLGGALGRIVARAAKSNVTRMARRFIAGSTTGEVVRAIRTLRRRHLAVTVDVLGEAVISEPEADAYAQAYVDLLRETARATERFPEDPLIDRAHDGSLLPRTNISLKPSALTAIFDPIDPKGTLAAVLPRLRRILDAALSVGGFVYVDVEHRELRDLTLELFQTIMMEPRYRDYPHVGVVVQAYLEDCEDVVRHLARWARERGTPVSVRLVKGAYWDYETVIARQRGWPVPVWEEKWQTDRAFERCTELLLDHHDVLRPAFGSHNVRSIAHALASARARGVPERLIEFQKLYGMADPLESALTSLGQRVRVYTPYGQLIPGMAYLVRRLLENTSNESFVRHHFIEGQSAEALLAPPSAPARPAPARRGAALQDWERQDLPLQGSERRHPSQRMRVSLSEHEDLSAVFGRSPRAASLPREGGSEEALAELADDELTEELVEVQDDEEWPEGLVELSDSELHQSFPPAAFETIDGPGEAAPAASLASATTPSGATAHLAQGGPHGDARRPASGSRAFHNEPLADFSRAPVRDAMQAALGALRAELPLSAPLVLAEERHATAERLTSECPSDTRLIVGTSAQATADHADTAVRMALAEWRSWRKTPVAERAAVLERAATLLGQRRARLAALVCLEAGKPWRDADAEVAEAMDFCRFYAAEMRSLAEPRRWPLPGEDNTTVYAPRGVTAAISPWNFPLAILCGMTTAPLVAGNAVIMKPAEQTPLCGYEVYRALRDAGTPAGALHFLPGVGEVVGARLVEHPEVACITFTGSRSVGHWIAERAAQTSTGSIGIKRVVAEMGGKNAIIVDADADLDEAIPAILASAFGYAGQKCSACSRVIVVGGIYDAFLRRLAEAAQALVVGDCAEPGSFVGPLIDASSVERVTRYVEQGRRDGRLVWQAQLGAGTEHGHFFPPTVLADLRASCPVLREEIFGPVLAVLGARDFAEALRVATEVDYALTGGVFSRSPRNVERARAAFDVGNLYINRKITGAFVGRQPFGGFRHSGMGAKAGSRDYLRQFLVQRTITENTLRRGFAPES